MHHNMNTNNLLGDIHYIKKESKEEMNITFNENQINLKII